MSQNCYISTISWSFLVMRGNLKCYWIHWSFELYHPIDINRWIVFVVGGGSQRYFGITQKQSCQCIALTHFYALTCLLLHNYVYPLGKIAPQLLKNRLYEVIYILCIAICYFFLTHELYEKVSRQIFLH